MANLEVPRSRCNRQKAHIFHRALLRVNGVKWFGISCVWKCREGHADLAAEVLDTSKTSHPPETTPTHLTLSWGVAADSQHPSLDTPTKYGGTYLVQKSFDIALPSTLDKITAARIQRTKQTRIISVTASASPHKWSRGVPICRNKTTRTTKRSRYWTALSGLAEKAVISGATAIPIKHNTLG